MRPAGFDEATSHELMSRVRCPVLVIQGTEDALIPADRGAAFAAATGGRLVTMEGAGHSPHARDPVRFNLLLSDFANACWGRPQEPQTWRRAVTRSKRALYISSPIGLGHAWRDLAIVQELRRLQPGLTVDWLAQDPVTRVLEAAGERIHPASRHLANESRHIEAESDGHQLHAFEAIRRMDEILLANFMVFHEVARSQPYDLWIGDEAWELDYYLHENPELKTRPVLLADGLRRLAADARSRRARGHADRGLQRRDDRADRALPPRPRPVDLHRRSRRTSSRTRSARACL